MDENIIRVNLTKKERDYIFDRDFGLCGCCEMEGSEVHHITPVYKGGNNEPSNLILLCSECHNHAPDSKEEFEEYKQEGGQVTRMMWGKAIFELQKQIEKDNTISLKEGLIVIRKCINILKTTSFNYRNEKYGKNFRRFNKQCK